MILTTGAKRHLSLKQGLTALGLLFGEMGHPTLFLPPPIQQHAANLLGGGNS